MFGTMNMTIGKKLFLSIGAVVGAALVMGVLMYVNLARVGAGMDRVVNENVKRQYLANQMYINLTEMISLGFEPCHSATTGTCAGRGLGARLRVSRSHCQRRMPPPLRRHCPRSAARSSRGRAPSPSRPRPRVRAP